MASSLNAGCLAASVALFLLGLPNSESNFLIFELTKNQHYDFYSVSFLKDSIFLSLAMLFPL